MLKHPKIHATSHATGGVDAISAADIGAAATGTGVTNGNSHDHSGGDGAQVDHVGLANIGTNAHSAIDTFIGSKAAASGLASLDAGTLVVQDPANATATPTASKIVVADGGGKVDGWVTAASLTAAGKVELATTAEIDAGTDSARAMPTDQFVASKRNIRYINWRVLDKATDCSVLAGVGGDFECPFAGTLVSIGAYVDTAGTTGTMTVDVNKGGATLMTTNKITLDSTEKSSRTAATPPALTTTAVAEGDVFTVDIDAIHTTAAKGLTVRFGIRE